MSVAVVCCILVTGRSNCQSLSGQVEHGAASDAAEGIALVLLCAWHVICTEVETFVASAAKPACA